MDVGKGVCLIRRQQWFHLSQDNVNSISDTICEMNKQRCAVRGTDESGVSALIGVQVWSVKEEECVTFTVRGDNRFLIGHIRN